jgi:general secretion pathway protein G
MYLKSPAASITQRSANGALRAFTVLEIMVVIAIIGMLVGLTVANLDKLLGDSKTDLAGIFVHTSIKVPLQQYNMHMGDYPTTAEGLQALITPPANKADRWRGPYLQDNVIPLDPWKRPYQYRYPGTHNKTGYDIFSFGPSGQEDEKTVIGNW